MNRLLLRRWIFPRRCPICGQIVASGQGLVHEMCRQKLIYVKAPVCLRCGKPVYSPAQEYCLDCSKKTGRTMFDAGAAVWVYTKVLAVSIANFKYHGKQEYADFYAQEVLRLYGRWILLQAPEVITPVPLNRRKQRKRGYNQAALLVKKLGKALGIPTDEQLLVRTKFTAPQKELDAAQRRKNLSQAFCAGKNAAKYKRVLLVDDIYTTGSTMEICSKILKDCGVEYVAVLSLGIGSDY